MIPAPGVSPGAFGVANIDQTKMRISRIEKKLRHKIDDWMESIEDKKLAEDVRSKVVVMGGCIASMLMDEEPNDFDVYFTDSDIAKRVVEYYIRQAGMNENIGVQPIFEPDGIRIYGVGQNRSDTRFTPEKNKTGGNGEKYRPLCFTSNAISLDGDIQIVIRFVGSPEYIFRYYDYQHCKMYYSRTLNKVFASVESMDSLMNKNLKYTGSKFPVCSLFRMRKFMERGFTVNAGQITKMALQISQMDLTDPEVLTDQLIGVDYVIFRELLDSMKEITDDSGRVDNNLLIGLIDKYFD